MLAADEDAFVCDMMQTYHVTQYRELPVKLLATLAVGLGEGSRIYKILTGNQISVDQMLLASLADKLSILIWQNTQAGRDGVDRPESILDKLLGTEGIVEEEGFDSAEEMQQVRAEILEG